MHPLVEKLTRQYRLIGHTHPILMLLLEMGAAAQPKEKDRPLRRKIQMRMLRQWERLEDAFRGFMSAKATDEDLCECGERELEPFYLQNSGWLAPGTDPEDLRAAINVLLISATSIRQTKNRIMRAPNIEDQFNTVVTSSEPANTPLDKFLRGSMRSSNALARLLGEVREHLDNEGEPPSEDTIKEAEAALIEQGFTQ